MACGANLHGTQHARPADDLKLSTFFMRRDVTVMVRDCFFYYLLMISVTIKRLLLICKKNSLDRFQGKQK